MTSKADDHNTLLSTPVAKVAIDLFVDVLRSNVIAQGRVADAARANVDCAEAIITELQSRGHLPGTLVEVEEPKADDATLILQGMVLGEVTWEPYGPNDPRGRLRIGTAIDGYELATKLMGGVPVLSDTARDEILRRVKPLLRKL